MIPLTPEQMLALAKDSIKQAQEELKDYPDIPEHPGTFLIHSNVEPQGIYSEIDMELEARLKRSDTFAKRKNVLDQAMYAHVRNEVMTKGKELRDKITEISKKHRVLTRAARLAKNPEARNYLINEANKLKESPEIKDYSLLIEGLEAHSGVISSTISVACFDAYERHLNYLLPESVKHGSESYAKNDRINIEMRSMDDVMDDVKASLPGAKDKTPEELSKMYPNYSAFEKVVSPYAISSCRDTLDSYFKTLDDRLNMIIIDGETLRERMEKDRSDFKGLSKQQLDNLSCEYVTAAIKSGADIEAAVHFYELGQASLYTDVFIPITGSEPRGKKERITLNFWERWMSKLGFYKEKAQKFEAQQKMDACRKKILDNIKNSSALSGKRLDDNNLKERMSRISAAENLYKDKKYIDTYVKNVRRKEILDGERIKLKYSFFPEKRGQLLFQKSDSKLPNMGRDVPTYLCIGYMLEKGIPLEEAVNPSKHTEMRVEAGNWLTEAFNRQNPDEFDRIRVKCFELYADAVDKEAEKLKNAFKTPEDIYNNYALLTGVAYACICNMDGIQNKNIGPQVLGEEKYNKVRAKLSELESVYSVYNSSLGGSFERFQELIGPREIRIGSFISAQLHARSVLEGLKRTPPQFSPSFTMTDASTFSMIGESTQAKEYEATVENGNKEVIEDLLLTDGEKTLNMDLVILDKPSINTKTMGTLSPDMEFTLSYDVIMNGESLYGLADPVTKKQIEISEPELDEFSK